MEKNKAVNKKNELTIYQKLQLIQTSLKCPKTRTNNFAKYKYRNAEDILNAIKPFQQQLDFVLTTPTENINDQGYIYVQCTAILTCSKTEKQIRVFGKSFLHNQVRIIIGRLVNVGIGKWDNEKVRRRTFFEKVDPLRLPTARRPAEKDRKRIISFRTFRASHDFDW